MTGSGEDPAAASPGDSPVQWPAGLLEELTVTGWFTTNVGPHLHYTLVNPAGLTMDYWRDPDGNAGAQVESGTGPWHPLDERGPRYQSVMNAVREYESRHPDLARYNNPQQAAREEAHGNPGGPAPHAGPAEAPAAPDQVRPAAPEPAAAPGPACSPGSKSPAGRARRASGAPPSSVMPPGTRTRPGKRQ